MAPNADSYEEPAEEASGMHWDTPARRMVSDCG